MPWDDYVKDGVLEWLLEPQDPSVRFWALQHLDERAPKDSAVVDAQEAVMRSQCVQTIPQAQTPGGYWETADDMYNPKYKATTHTLLILAELGAERTWA